MQHMLAIPETVLIVTGQSGSGKSIALAALEDAGFYCIDNLPPELLDNLLLLFRQGEINARGIAISIDARSPEAALNALPARIQSLRKTYENLKIQSLFLEASEARLVARFSETRRRHPLSPKVEHLLEAIQREAELLAPMRHQADLIIDTSHTSIHQFREDIRNRILEGARRGPLILLQSFGFKNGIPLDSDFLFDIRHLPNPHWLPDLRPHGGKTTQVIEYLEQHPITHETRANLARFLGDTLAAITQTDRSYVTCSVGCTGGKHRSVYMVEHLYTDLKTAFPNILIRHRDLETER
ncbi:RNase adaptor protein RapZ [Halothiobacillus diazotrophicus]|uniref:RNase adaptor protein RapZ n=1 Tax=Halothiobacillus diazotrophicus TaxID=1860122 RepID=A0A191ZE57_9GAMM|nr:RNase adapter RapZ [Halothiobacillus diazotrophicus]ANJ66153.1 RNase adaptor protein RapZ [Halothiobacillus diazotrophicus]